MRIKEVLKEKGFTYKMLAEQMGVTEQSIKNTLNSASITTSTLERIAAAVNVPMWELVVSRDEVAVGELSALVYCEGEYYRATTLEELREVVKELEERLSEETSPSQNA